MPTSPPQPPDDSTQGADAGTDPATPPAPPRRRRVRMLVDVVDQADEVAYVTRLFEERGWTVRPATSDTVANRVTLVVEVRLHGARFGALRTATAAVERLVKQAELGAWVRDAALVEHAREPMTTYNVHRVQPSWRTLVTWLGLADEQRAVTVPAGPHSEDEARDQLTARALGGRAFDPSVHRLRVPGHSDASPPLDESAHDRRVRMGWTAAGAVGIVLAFVSGMYVAWADGSWKVLPAVLSASGAFPLARAARETRDRGPAVQWAAGLAGTSTIAACGALLGHELKPRLFWAVLLLMAAAGFTGTGVVLALRRTRFTRHATWLVPLSVPVLWSMVAWLGGEMHDEYLDRFDIRADSVPTPTLGRYLAAGEPVALALGSVLLLVAVLGWLRYLHAGRDSGFRLYGIVVTTLLAVLFTLTAIYLGADRATRAAGKAAQRTAAQGTEPPSYFGLKGHLMCLRPVDPTEPLPVENGPVITDHPVLFFGAATDWIWLWDPAHGDGDDWESFAVRREDVQLVPAKNPETKKCPPT